MNRFWSKFVISASISAAAAIVLLELGIGFVAIGALSWLLVTLFPALTPGQVAVSGFFTYFLAIFATLQVMLRMPRKYRAF